MPDLLAIRPAAPADFARIAAIYADAVVTGTASFEIDPPDRDEMARRHAAVTAAGFPWLVAAADGDILGYGYFSLYRTRPAYRFTVENSIYVAPAAKRRGVGRALLAELIGRAEAAGFRRMIAVIGDSENAASIGLHAALGFAPAGVLPSVGWKHGRWLDSVLMQRPLGPGDDAPPDERR
ncbi:MAG: N-acetyltransferase family protein [Hyphomicrobiales bacterium]|nr:N-acetyltransferase family protein [Hyphomicrobiales bacterium]